MPDNNDERTRPLASYTPTDPAWVSLELGAKLVRIYDHEDAAKNGFTFTDFNPTMVKDRRWVRGRFSSTRRKPFSYLYLGQNEVDERIAILEYLDYKDMQRDGSNEARRRIRRAQVAHLSFAYFEVVNQIPLVDITNRPDARRLKANLDVLEGKNHKLTREWARYIRKVVPTNQGLLYRPNRYGSTAEGFAVVLFAPHFQSSSSIQPVGLPIPLADPAGRDRLLRCSDATNFVPDW
jgi:hypothetical protein